MKWFYNMKIRAKLILCFSILAIFTGIVGIVGISNMNTINHRSERMYYDNFIPVENLMSIQNALQEVRANQLLSIYEKNPATLQDKLDIIDRATETTNQLLEDYKKTINDDETMALYNNVIDSLTEYRTIRGKNLELVNSGDYNAALETLAEVTEARIKSFDSLQVLIDHNTRLASDAVQNNAKNFASLSFVMMVVIIVAVVVAATLGLFISSVTSKQLKHLVNVADLIADGNLDVNIELDTKDEIGILGQAFKRMAENINEVMYNINAASEQVAAGARQVSDSSMALSQGATEQASSVEQLTASVEEISVQTQHNADNANQANKLAKAAKASALQGNAQMEEMLQAMEDINESSNNISKIIKVIDDIAFQTNILALNAAVEAARAGQHGKGFAVVAEEVRTLAARSANAAKETTDMIEGSIKKAVDGTKIAKETAESLNEIVNEIEKVAVLVNDIANSSNEQATGVGQINQGIMQVSNVVQMNSATSEESAAASEELSNQAELLKEMVEKFKLKRISKFFNRYEELNPEVIKTIENMSDKKKFRDYHTDGEEVDLARSQPKIVLNDSEFGKY